MRIPFSLIMIFQYLAIAGQSNLIKGKITDSNSGLPVPFANIYNFDTGRGTISNDDGQFQIELSNTGDSIIITCIGFEDQLIQIEEDKQFYSIQLDGRTELLNEIVVTPKDNWFLFDLLARCKKNQKREDKKARAIYELRTFKDSSLIELLEGYYNVDIWGYDVTGLSLKAGRLALQPYKNRFFTSQESSRAIAMLKLMEQDPYMPLSPLNLGRRKMAKNFYLNLDNKYRLPDSDSIYVISFETGKIKNSAFSGTVWINKTDETVIKIVLSCEDCGKHPFIPLFPSDSIKRVNFEITKTFSEKEDKMVFKHIDFNYSIDYKSRIGENNELAYSVNTKAVLYAYDYSSPFFIPKFEFKTVGDYTKINAFPVNHFFWENHNEYHLDGSRERNQNFYDDSLSLTNPALFESNPQTKTAFFQYPYIHWSEKRIKFQKMIPDTTGNNEAGILRGDQYNLEAKVFVDINTYGDSTNILTATIFDPYESYYYLPIDKKTHCFVNIFFDLCEIQRRKLEKYIQPYLDQPNAIDQIYQTFLDEFEEMKSRYLRSVQSGTNEKEMIKWNNMVVEQLGIDNIVIFKPFQE